MKREDLIKSAKNLPVVEPKNAEEFSSKLESLISKMNKVMEAREDIVAMVGAKNMTMMRDNHSNHGRFMESIFYQKSTETLVDTVLWVFKAYISRNFNSTYWAAQLNTWIEIYKKELSPECYKAIYPYYQWMQINIPSFTIIAENNLKAPNSVHK